MFAAVLFRAFFLLFIAVSLSGCVTARTGFDFAAVMRKVGPPPAGHSRIVVLSEKGSVTYGGVADLVIGGVPTKQVRPGVYVYADQRAGKHQIIGTQSMFPGETKYDITTVAGRTYFLIARNSARAGTVTGSTLGAGLAGGLLAMAITAGYDNPGPVDLLPLDEAAARTALADLQLAE